MTVLYTNNFDSATVGSIAPGWINVNGSWTVQATQPVSSPNAFGSSTKGANNITVYTGISARADMGMTASRKAGSTLYPMGFILRGDTSGATWYTIEISPASTAGLLHVTIYSFVNSFTNVVYDADTTVSWASGDTLYTRVQCIGTDIKVFLWRNAESIPGTATVSVTNSDVTSSGYAGLYHFAAGQTVVVDDVHIDDGTPTVTTYATLTGPTTGTVGVASTSFTVTLSTTAGTTTTITPSDSAGGGTFTPTTVSIAAGATTGTFTYTAASSGSKSISITSTNGYTPAGSPITYTASSPSSATSVTVSGPTSGGVGSGVTLTATLNGTLASATHVTLADSNTGTFSPNPVTIAIGATSGTTTFTPTVVGTHNVTITNDQSLSNLGSPLVYTAAGGSTGNIPVDDPGLYWSPYNWDTLNVGTFGVTVKSKQTTCCGAYLKFNCSSTANVALSIDGTPTAGIGTNRPVIAYSINYGPVQTQMIAGGPGNVTIATGLTGTNFIEVWLLASDEASGDRWGLSTVSPSNILRIDQIVLDTGGTVNLPTLRPKRAIFYGDSIVEGVRSGRSTTYPADHARSSAWQVCRGLNAEYAVIGYGAQGWELAGDGNVLPFISSWNLHSDSRSRSFSPTVDYVYVMLGYNGGAVAATVTSWINTARTALGASTWIFIVQPPSGRSAAATATGVANYLSAHPSDTKVALIDYSDVIPITGFDSYPSVTEWCIDGVHPDYNANAIIASAIVQKSQAAIGGTGGSGGTYPTASQVISGVTFGPTGSDYTGNVTLPAATNVRSGVSYGTSGTAQTGNMTLPTAAQVQSGVPFGANGTQYTGTLADAWSTTIEGGYTAGQLLKAMSAVLLGKSTGQNTNSPVFRDVNDTKNRVVATTDSSGNRSAVTLDLS